MIYLYVEIMNGHAVHLNSNVNTFSQIIKENPSLIILKIVLMLMIRLHRNKCSKYVIKNCSHHQQSFVNILHFWHAARDPEAFLV